MSPSHREIEAAALADSVESLLNSLDDRGRTIAELTLQGYSPAQIADRVGLSERSVFRKLEGIRASLEVSRSEE